MYIVYLIINYALYPSAHNLTKISQVLYFLNLSWVVIGNVIQLGSNTHSNANIEDNDDVLSLSNHIVLDTTCISYRLPVWRDKKTKGMLTVNASPDLLHTCWYCYYRNQWDLRMLCTLSLEWRHQLSVEIWRGNLSKITGQNYTPCMREDFYWLI